MKLFVGFEEKHPEMFYVCKESIRRHNSHIKVIPLVKNELSCYSRPFGGESTDFAFTRFLVPYLSNYEGISIFCDGDFLWRCDPEELLQFVESEPVYVVKHPILVTKTNTKMEGQRNLPYSRKYWSSLMVFNNIYCTDLTLKAVNTAPASWLHRLAWAREKIGELPATYNYLVGHYGFQNPKAVHFTDGGPWLPGYKNVEFASEWFSIYDDIYK